MKKFSIFFLLVCFALVSYAQSYGIMISGTDYHAGTLNPTPLDPSFTEYQVLGVEVAANATLQLWDKDNAAGWAVDLDAASVKAITKSGDHYVCATAGCYDFYIKLKYGADQLYIGACAGGGGGEGDCKDGPYGITVNGKTVDAPLYGEPDAQGRIQYKAACVELAKGDEIKLINQSCDATWMVDIDPYGEYQKFTGGKEAGKITCTTAGKYDFYIKLSATEGDVLYIGECGGGGGGDDPASDRPSYATSVPSQAPDVILQAFYYDSYEKGKGAGTNLYGDTKWTTLLPQASEISAYFDIVWLPPSAMSEGGTGYHPRQYSNQSSAWGSRSDLDKLVAAFHNGGAKVVGDIVANHAGCKSSWCDYFEMDFGAYGKFQPDASWITNDDEVWSSSDPGASECKKGSGAKADDGYGSEAKYGAARDWDHQQEQVRAMFRAYLKWMKNVMMFDGWRYDYCKGFHMSHVNDYNAAAKNYISILEFWSSKEDIMDRIKDAGYNTMAFDFPTKYQAFNDGIAKGNYANCKMTGLLGMGNAKYAVTFVDNHDTFLRDDNEVYGNGNSMNHKNEMLQCNAFILAMPGIPCVLYPHWKSWKAEIKPMIEARHKAGVHSESAVSEESAESGGYTCKVTGKNGWLVLQLGNKVTSSYSGATKAASGNGYAIWVHTNGDVAPQVIVTPGDTKFKDAAAGITVSLEAVGGTGDGVIYYTTDGTDPTTTSKSISKKGTLNFKETTTLKVMGVCGTAKSEIQTFKYTYVDQKGGITVRFLKPADWTSVYFFAWKGETQILGGWPGKAMAQGADGWYSQTFDEQYTEFNFIINQGKTGMQSGDLLIESDMCYTWEGQNEKEIDCDAPIVVDFGLSVSPASQIFRDNTNGIKVTLTVVAGSDAAKIYYTTDGSEPTTSSQSFTKAGELTFKQTTTLKAFAMDGSKKTEVVTRTYTYKEPQSGPITVSFKSPGWSKVNLYAWTTDASQTPVLGKWPGTQMTQQDQYGAYYYTFDAQYKAINIIWNNGSDQTSDILVEENSCFVWNTEAKDADLVDCDAMGVENIAKDTPRLDFKAPMYNILGQQVDATYRGIIIQNGHKFLIQ